MKDRNPSFRLWIFFSIKHKTCIKKQTSLASQYAMGSGGGRYIGNRLERCIPKLTIKKKLNESKGKKELGKRCSKMGLLSVIQQSSVFGNEVFCRLQ